MDALLALGDRAVLVRGNADREVVEAARGGACEHPESVFAAAELGPERVAVLASLPHPVTAAVSGFGPVVFCHGTPRDDDEVVLVDTRPARWAEVFADLPDEVRTVCCGHTHMPFVRLVDRRVVAESTYPDARTWVDEYVRGEHSDMDALTAFGPRDGR